MGKSLQKQEEFEWLTSREVGEFFGVKPKTVAKWVLEGKLRDRVRTTRTPGGHHRYYAPDVMKILDDHENGAEHDKP